jgi:hypothetical protein
MCFLTIRGELKGVSTPQQPNACRIRFTTPTSFSLNVSKENYLIMQDFLNAITETVAGVDQEMLLRVLKPEIKSVIKHEGKYHTR